MAVTEAEDLRFDLRGLLTAFESVPPIEAVEVLAAELARMLDATEVSLLVANFSGTAAVRMSHANASQSGATDGANERTESLTLEDSPHHRVLKTQERHVEPHGGGWRVLVPITERGDAMGMLARNLLATTGGNLRDDATVLCVDWFGPRGVRNATGGASVDRATND